jgi:transposase
MSGPPSSRCCPTSRAAFGVNDRRVLNGIFWVLRSGAPWRDLPENHGPYTTWHGNDDGIVVRARRKLLKRINVICPVQSHLQKYFTSPVGQIISTSSRHPTPPEGRIAIVTDAGCGCGGRGSVLRATGLQGGLRPVSDQQHADERCCSRTAKSCGPDAPTLASSSRSCVGPTGLRQNLNPLMTVAREPGHRGEHDISCKTIACGNAGRSGVLVVTRVLSTNTKCTRGRGCNGHPAFPTPSMGREIFAQLGRIVPRDREVVCGLEFDVVAERKRPRLRHSGAMRSIEPGISRFPDAQLRI